MGGYAFYVWTAYAIALVILVANFIEPKRRERRLLEEIQRKSRLSRRES